MGLAKYKRRTVRKRDEVIQCEKVKGGFIFEVSEGHFIPGDKRVVRNSADAITLFIKLICGEKLNEITILKEEKKFDLGLESAKIIKEKEKKE